MCLLVGLLLGTAVAFYAVKDNHRIHVVSASMSPTIEAGATLWMDTSIGGSEIRPGDIVVFTDPGGWNLSTDEPRLITKRVIAIGGQALSCCDSGHHLVRDGLPLIEPYLPDASTPSELAFEVTVPAGQLWVMGDNRAHSFDSRQHALSGGNGFVSLSTVRGVVPDPATR